LCFIVLLRCWYGDLLDRIVVDERVMCGKPVIRGTRVTVEAVIRRLAEGLSIEEVLEDFSQLTREDIRTALLYASKLLEDETIIVVRT